uniref:PKD_channel domain-containing protein n=1 Tax=Globodera pallida TaxID=36090 RepID=A0A183CNL3_GLOPA
MVIKDRLVGIDPLPPSELEIAAAILIEMAVVLDESQYNYSRLGQYLCRTVDTFAVGILLPQISAFIGETNTFLSAQHLRNLVLFLAELYDKLEVNGVKSSELAAHLFDQLRNLLKLNIPITDKTVDVIVKTLKLVGRFLENDRGPQAMAEFLAEFDQSVQDTDAQLSESAREKVRCLFTLRENKWGIVAESNIGDGTTAPSTSVGIIGPDGVPLTEDECAFMEENLDAFENSPGGSQGLNAFDEDNVEDDYEKFLQATAIRAAEKALEKVSIDEDDDVSSVVSSVGEIPTTVTTPANCNCVLTLSALFLDFHIIMTVEDIAGTLRQQSLSNEELMDTFPDGLFFNFNERLDRLELEQREIGTRLRRHLQFFFMNPLDKYRIRQQFPFKLFLQVLKVAFVTIQLILFAQLRISHVDFLDETLTVMRHKFLKEWGDERDTRTYPPASGPYSVYTSDQIIEHFSHIVKAYYSIQNDSFAAFSYDTSIAQMPYKDVWDDELGKAHIVDEHQSLRRHIAFGSIPPLQLCIDRIADVSIENETYIFDISEETDCFLLNFTQKEVLDVFRDPYTIRRLLVQRNITFKAEDALIVSKAFINFNLRTIHFSTLQNDQKPECYLIKLIVCFDNSRHTGQIKVDLIAAISYINLCNGRILQVNSIGLDTVVIAVIDVFVLCMCLGSLMLCARALVKGHLLKKTTCDFFERAFGIRMNIKDQWEFLNLWYAMIVVNDLLIIAGTVSKASIQFRDFDSALFTLTGILLGLGVFMVFFGLLRYFTFFSQYNIIILTLRKSLPSIMRFLVCAVILYSGFLFAGWVIIGPYSLKFRTLGESSEALFSLLNGDDMFATFYTISDDNTVIKVFGTVYIYLFVSLFIYVVLSLFIAIIMDAYEVEQIWGQYRVKVFFEVVKNRHNPAMDVQRSTLHEFLASSEMPNAGTHEARELFAPDQLLRLEDNWPFLRNWTDLRGAMPLRNPFRGNSGPGTSVGGGRFSGNNGGPFFDYQSFENTTGLSRASTHNDVSVLDATTIDVGNEQSNVEQGQNDQQPLYIGSMEGVPPEMQQLPADSLRMSRFIVTAPSTSQMPSRS